MRLQPQTDTRPRPQPSPIINDEYRRALIRAGYEFDGTGDGYEFWLDPDGQLFSRRLPVSDDETQAIRKRAWESRIVHSFKAYMHANAKEDWTIPESWPRQRRQVALNIRTQVAKWFNSQSQNPHASTLALAGHAGCGKTLLACAVLRGLVMGGESSWQAWTVRELCDAHKATFDDATKTSPVDACISARVLFLDDLGAHSRSAFDAELLLKIVDGRKNRNPHGAMILTTNAGAIGQADFWAGLLSEKADAHPVVARLASRLAQGAVLVPFGSGSGESWEPLPDWRKGAA